ncbi:MAG: hypothetical protein LC623_06740 [Halobacteriales archaeon]|nr:hypothetical protein [Halobacteriales archaeon]
MNPRPLLALAFVVVATLPAASAAAPICTPAFPAKPVPGGVVGTAWDTAAGVYNQVPTQCAPTLLQIVVLVQGVVTTAEARANGVCQILIGEDCSDAIPPL